MGTTEEKMLVRDKTMYVWHTLNKILLLAKHESMLNATVQQLLY